MDVLSVMEVHDKQTRIQYAANLDYVKIRTILENLIDRGLVKEHVKRNRKWYRLTEEGQALLNHIKTVRRQLKGIWDPKYEATFYGLALHSE